MDKVSLEDFIYETLLSISSAVSNAQIESKKRGGIPIALSAVGEEPVKAGEQLVSFSVSVEANARREGKLSGGIKGNIISVVTGSVDLDGSSEKRNTSLHSIQFNVPIYFNSRWPDMGVQ